MSALIEQSRNKRERERERYVIERNQIFHSIGIMVHINLGHLEHFFHLLRFLYTSIFGIT